MKVILTIILVNIVTLTCWSQNVVTDSTVTAVAYWKQGDRKKYELKTKIVELKNGKKTTENVEFDAIFTLYIADSTEDSYVLHWEPINQILYGEMAKNPVFDKIQKLGEGFVSEYRTDELGTFQELVNWEDFQLLMMDALDIIEKDLSASDEEVNLQPLKDMREMYSQREAIEMQLTTGIRFVHAPYGMEYSIGHTSSFEIEIPNELGRPFPGIYSMEATKVDEVNDRFHIVLIQEADDKKATDIFTQWVKEQSGKNSPDIPVKLSSRWEYDIELSTGWIIGGTYTNRFEVDGLVKLQTYTLKRL